MELELFIFKIDIIMQYLCEYYLFVILLCKFCSFPMSSATADPSKSNLPLVISTWSTEDFQAAAQKAFDTLLSLPFANNGSFRRLNALVEGLSECERRQCDGTVGFGGSPDEKGETTLDSLVMDGPGHKSGSVAAIRRIKSAAKVAWAVMNYTEHSLLVGEKATEFALAMGFKEESLETPESKEMHRKWLDSNCQPNFWKNVHPDPNSNCGPYHPANWLQFGTPNPNWKNILLDQTEAFGQFWLPKFIKWNRPIFDGTNHDTIGMVVIDEAKNVSVGTSSNGARNKIPGRVGDSPIVGAGAYLDNQIGGAAATGDGDIMMRFAPSFLTVELMRQGKTPSEATAEAIGRIKKFYPKFSGAIIAANVQGNFGAACAGMEKFGYSVVNSKMRKVQVEWIRC